MPAARHLAGRPGAREPSWRRSPRRGSGRSERGRGSGASPPGRPSPASGRPSVPGRRAASRARQRLRPRSQPRPPRAQLRQKARATCWLVMLSSASRMSGVASACRRDRQARRLRKRPRAVRRRDPAPAITEARQSKRSDCRTGLARYPAKPISSSWSISPWSPSEVSRTRREASEGPVRLDQSEPDRRRPFRACACPRSRRRMGRRRPGRCGAPEARTAHRRLHQVARPRLGAEHPGLREFVALSSTMRIRAPRAVQRAARRTSAGRSLPSEAGREPELGALRPRR